MELVKRIKDVEIFRLLFFLFWIGISLAAGRLYQLIIGGWIGMAIGIIVFLFLAAFTVVAIMGDG